MAVLLRSPLHGLLSRSTLLITVTGRKSGRAYTTPVSYVRHGETLLVLSQADRSWWKNLRGGAPVTLRLAGRDVRAIGQVIEDQQTVADSFLVMLRLLPQYQRYMGIELDADGQPVDPVRFAQVAAGRVIVRLSDLKPA